MAERPLFVYPDFLVPQRPVADCRSHPREAGIESFRETSIRDRESLSLAYKARVESLERLRDDWRAFIETLVRIDLSQVPNESKLVGQISQEESTRWRKEILSDPSLQPIPMSSGLVGSVISQNVSDAFDDLVIDLEVKVENLQCSFCQQLARLIELEVCGILVRHPHHVYEYRYFYRTVSASSKGERVDSKLIWRDDPESESPVQIRQTANVIDAKVTRTVFGRIHHLIHAIEISPDRPTVPTPEYHQSVLDAIPGWLRPLTTLVEGTLVGNVAPTTGRSTELDRTAAEIVNEWAVQPLFHGDPALVLGQFVLTGWGPEELGSQSNETRERLRSDRRRGGGDESLLAIAAKSIGSRMLSKVKSFRDRGAKGEQDQPA